MKRFALTLDLKNDPKLIEQYIRHHESVWPEILESIRGSGITGMEIFHVDTRLFMLMETTDAFTFEHKNKLDQENVKVQEWERLMDEYQQRLPFATNDEKWVLMHRIFKL